MPPPALAGVGHIAFHRDVASVRAHVSFVTRFKFMCKFRCKFMSYVSLAANNFYAFWARKLKLWWNFFSKKYLCFFLISSWKHLLWVLIQSASAKCFSMFLLRGVSNEYLKHRLTLMLCICIRSTSPQHTFSWRYRKVIKMALTLVLLNKFRCHAHF